MNENPPHPENTVQYQLSREEAIDNLFRLMLTRRLLISSVLLILLGVGDILLFSKTEHLSWGWSLIIFPFVLLFFLRRTVHRILKQHPEFLEKQGMSFDENGVAFTNSVMQLRWPWDRVRRVTETDNFVVLRTDTMGTGAFIPKRAFNPEQQERFLTYARAGQAKR